MTHVNHVRAIGVIAAATLVLAAGAPTGAAAKQPFARDKHGVPVGYVCYKGEYHWNCYLPSQRVPPAKQCYTGVDGKIECFSPSSKLTSKRQLPPMMYCEGPDAAVSYVCSDSPSPAPPPPPPVAPAMPPHR